ncbi:uncharacterized protein LOC126659965 isoform X1 [Mercurialis annua]|uniref:uncharacterized protein LOC126659965 isoform X1 n=1 Tax=Mercurialis annua TaxID=3986 RepID=UPI00215FEBFE|nr:uncharacterized protein LOC126659965 isoform X1 [Mercurialis annua]
MGVLLKIVDALLLMNYVVMAFATPLIDSQTCLPAEMFPEKLIKLRSWYTQGCGDFLYEEKPTFFVAMVWTEMIFHWPLVLLNIYAMLTSKPWFQTTCLIYGTSIATSMVPVLAVVLSSGRASAELMGNYYPYMAIAILGIVRGLLPINTALATSNKPTSSIKKKA